MQAVQDENEQGKFKLVSIRMRDARQMIDNIDFEQAFNEYRETTHLDVLPDELWPTGFELAYIYLQAGKTQDGAYLLAETLKHLERANKLPERLQDLPLPDNTDTAAMLERLRQSEPEYYLKMERRYFPNMIFIKGRTFDIGYGMGDGVRNDHGIGIKRLLMVFGTPRRGSTLSVKKRLMTKNSGIRNPWMPSRIKPTQSAAAGSWLPQGTFGI